MNAPSSTASPAGWPRMGLAIALVALALVGGLLLARPTSADGAPRVVKLGALVTSMGDFDVAEHSFRATFWLWTTVPRSYGDPLDEIDYANAKSVRVETEVAIPQANGTVWHQRKVSGTFEHDFQMQSFPFDSQALAILLENNAYDTSTVVFRPDTANSANDADLARSGWTVDAFTISAGTKRYLTTFGDPTLKPNSPSYYSRLAIVTEISRVGTLTLLKLTIAAITAILLAAGSYFVNVDSAINARFAMLAASVFALVVSLQTAASAGGDGSLTLLDRLHAVALAYVVVAVVVSVVAHVMSSRGAPMARINRLERNAGIASSAALGVLVLLLLVVN